MPWLSELLDWLGTRNLTLLADSLISRDQAKNAFSTVHQFVILAFVCLFGAPAIFQCLLVGCLPCWICCLLPGWHDHTLQHLGWAYAAGSCSAGVLVAGWGHYQPKERGIVSGLPLLQQASAHYNLPTDEDQRGVHQFLGLAVYYGEVYPKHPFWVGPSDPPRKVSHIWSNGRTGSRWHLRGWNTPTFFLPVILQTSASN